MEPWVPGPRWRNRHVQSLCKNGLLTGGLSGGTQVSQAWVYLPSHGHCVLCHQNWIVPVRDQRQAFPWRILRSWPNATCLLQGLRGQPPSTCSTLTLLQQSRGSHRLLCPMVVDLQAHSAHLLHGQDPNLVASLFSSCCVSWVPSCTHLFASYLVNISWLPGTCYMFPELTVNKYTRSTKDFMREHLSAASA
jgi:hypothetical protein